MILVVFSHVEYFGYNLKPDDSILNTLFMSFRMPLFFFTSGYIAYKAGKIWDGQTWKTNILKKISIQLIPTLIFGLSYALLFNYSAKQFITDPGKLGYWFTLSLLSMFTIYYTINYLFHKQQNQTKHMISLIITATIALFISRFISTSNNRYIIIVNSIFSLYSTLYYFIFFVLGNLAAHYKHLFEKHIDNKYIITSIITLFAILMYWGKLYFVARCCGVIIVYTFFRKYQNSFSGSTRIGAGLQYIGRRTLDIYLLHYFFLPTFPFLGTYFASNNNLVLQLILGIGISLLIIGVCLVVSNIIRTSDFLAQHLFGAKVPNKKD